MITVGIPTYNEEKVIQKSILSVLKQISEEDEVIVVASGCTDKTIENIKDIKDSRVNLIVEYSRNGKASAINLITKAAKSEIIVQTDGDVEVEDGAIKELVKHFKDKTIGAVSGNPIPIIPKKNLFYDWTHMSYRKIGEIREKEMKNETFNVHLSGYLLAFRRDALDDLPFVKGAVDARMGKIIRDKGYKLIYEKEAKVFVKAPLTIRDFVRQKARVRAGFQYLPEGPRTMKSEFLYFPLELFKIPIWRWPKFIFSGFVYFYTWIKGKYLAKKDGSLEEIWKTPNSTK